MKIRHIVPALIVVSAITTSCGGSDSSSSAETVAANQKSMQTAPGSNSTSQFCSFAGLSTGAATTAFSEDGGGINEAEFWKESLTSAVQMVEGAPDEVKNDAMTVQAGLVAYESYLAKFGYDTSKMNADSVTTSAVMALNTQGAITNAIDAVNAYIDTHC